LIASQKKRAVNCLGMKVLLLEFADLLMKKGKVSGSATLVQNWNESERPKSNPFVFYVQVMMVKNMKKSFVLTFPFLLTLSPTFLGNTKKRLQDVMFLHNSLSVFVEDETVVPFCQVSKMSEILLRYCEKNSEYHVIKKIIFHFSFS
jgi:hypothetical protein